jgi:hypothetical protein
MFTTALVAEKIAKIKLFEFLQYLGLINLSFSSKFLFGNKTNHFSLADSPPASENREIET